MLFVACLFGLFFCCFGIFVAHVFVCILFWALFFAVLGFFALTVSGLWVHIKYSYIHAHKPIITLYYYKNEPHVLLFLELCMFFFNVLYGFGCLYFLEFPLFLSLIFNKI